ncbi:nucleotidyltransferase [Pedobacter cryoconitis]|uniref:nucleotidyltransferase domain-containing protein n=1 Tax=Pedobacter cryoconitis TaxID=188932 RepID=UPI00160859D0|nr:nucleotidyltransferase [Pedobacter cryoconitis]MBB5645983.1 hypothetical protein [Pedobacter cryoconitis]
MAKFSEETFNSWRMPPSASEQDKLDNSLRLVREALREDPVLSKKSIEVFAQGSYANDTNVRLNSDIDVNVRLNDAIFTRVPDGETSEDYGYTDSTYTFATFKAQVQNALIQKFGIGNITRNDKCITVKESPTRVVTDVVPTFKYNRHDSKTSLSVGARFISDKGNAIICYPLQHIENGKTKNARTQKRFKRVTRLYRRIRYKMIDDKVAVSDNITSFLLECLVWNVPDHIFNNYDTWTERLRQSIIYLYQNTGEDSKCNTWGEVSELLYLFRDSRKWSRVDVNNYLVQMWNYLGF